MYRLDLTKEELATLKRMLTNKTKEIHAWRIAVDSHVRDVEYEDIVKVLNKVVHARRGG